MAGSHLSSAEKARIDRMHAMGDGPTIIARALNRDYKTVKTYLAKVEADNGRSYEARRLDEKVPAVKRREDLGPEALRALEEFSFHRRRYYGRVTFRWNDVAAERIVELLESPKKEYVVLNCPPGVGKTTTFTHDLPAWLTTRNRAIRGLLGHRSEREAAKYTNRLRRTLERRIPFQPDDTLITRGLAFPAEATLVDDYGRFKPVTRDAWRAEEFVVAQPGDLLVAEKEMTWTSYGMDSAQIGNRFEFIDWDDLVTRATIRTLEAIAGQREWWTDEAETRLEPGGLLLLVGQRLGPNDLYRFALDMAAGDDEEFDDEEVGDVHVIDMEQLVNESPKKYVHIKFQAHDEVRCAALKAQGINPHRRDAPAQPEGCLLDPLRLPYRELSAKQKADDGKYQIIYQQEDVDPSGVLVPMLWVTGGTDPATGEQFMGCWDNDRGLCELPKGLDGPLLSFMTIDPSVANFWAFQWWVVHPESGQRFLMDCERRRMSAEALLDYLVDEGRFVGLLEEWVLRSEQVSFQVGRPVRITHAVLEKVAAFKFLLVYDYAKRWMRQRSVTVVPHDTNINKHHVELGVTSIAPHWKYGRNRLPGRGMARVASLKLVEEVTRYRTDGSPSGTDDQVMADWMKEWNLPRLLNTLPKAPTVQRRPRFVRSSFQGELAVVR